jgi:PadR family transcriptional regulator PadR
MNLENTKAQMRKGVLELCILSILSNQEAYPSDIIERLKQGELIVVEGTLYPMLSRLKNAGLLSYSWRESPAGPPRKYFQITDIGRDFLSELHRSWGDLVVAVHRTTENSITK